MPKFKHPYPNEFKILLACTGLNADNTENILTLTEQSPPNWPTVFQLAERHGILPLVWHNLKNLGLPSIPEATKQLAQQQFINNTQRALLQSAELAKLTRLFKGNGIKLISLKGPALALQEYGNLSLRHAGDIDLLLINPENIWQAHALMQQAGYQYTGIDFETLTSLQKSTYLKLDQHFCYLNKTGMMTIELHFRWAKNPYYFQLSTEDAWQRRREITVANTKVNTLSFTHQLLYLCSHGAGHAWARLQWLCDIPIIMNKASSDDFVQIKELTRKLGEQRKMAQAIQLSTELLNMPVPAALEELKPDKTIKQLVIVAKDEIIREIPYWQTSYSLVKMISLKIRLLTYKPRLKQGIRYTGYSLYLKSINTDDWNIVPLPDRLFFLYYILQPLLWFGKLIKTKATKNIDENN